MMESYIMKKSIALILFLLVILSFCGCVTRKDHMTGTPMVKVILKQSDEQKDKLFYYIVDNERHAEKTDVFIADSDVTIFYADTYNDFKCEVVSGKVINTLTGTKGVDKNGNTVMADEITTEIMQIAANSIEHEMYDFSICVPKANYLFLLS